MPRVRLTSPKNFQEIRPIEATLYKNGGQIYVDGGEVPSSNYVPMDFSQPVPYFPTTDSNEPQTQIPEQPAVPQYNVGDELDLSPEEYQALLDSGFELEDLQ